MPEQTNSQSKKHSVKVIQSSIFGIAQLTNERKKFSIPFDPILSKGFYNRTFIAVDAKNPELTLGYLIFKVTPGKPAQLIRFSVREGFERKRIGRQLFGKVRGYLHRIGINKIITTNDVTKNAIKFYKEVLKMKEVKGSKESQFELKIKPTHRKRTIRILPPTVIAPQNVLNKDLLLRRRFLRGR